MVNDFANSDKEYKFCHFNIVGTPFLWRGRGWVFEIFPFPKIRGSNFYHKNGGVSKIEGCFKKGRVPYYLLSH